MRIVIQRVLSASVVIDNELYNKIEQGMLLLVCHEAGDNEQTLHKATEKISKLRIFDDEHGKINLNLNQINGEILSISQFTLSWDGSSGHRPSFEKSLPPNEARLQYALFNKELRAKELSVKEGVFGASMKISLVNDGPVTFVLDF